MEQNNIGIPKNYNPKEWEEKLYHDWEASGFFNPDVCVEKGITSKDSPSYTIILPPPNITDKLHLGHSSMLAIEDLLIRLHRMKGYRTLWVPGTDHAAIATQNVVEKKLHKETGKTRHDLGREEFLKLVWEFLKETQATILNQTRKMGASLDWSREAFTLDEQRQKAVRQMFVDMYREGIVYQGKRIVNWCPRCHSTLADDEIEYKAQKTKLYWIKYGPFVLATTRPETKLGDTAVAVNPKDKRYKDMIGKQYTIKGVLGDFDITVIADHHVDMDFGSGAVKVTPAHSFADNQMAQKNDIPMKQIINEDGKMMSNCGKYAGMPVSEAREAIVQDMQEMELIDHIDDGYANKLSVCYRCDSTIEPLPSKQWFISVDKKLERLGNLSLKEKAIEVAKNKDIQFIPFRFTNRYLDWMENLHDWCISRQIWFGHRIPVWYCTKTGQQNTTHTECEKPIVSIEKVEKCPHCEGDVKQDPDSLDTWFSSGMWTFSVLGWPDTFQNGEKSGDLKKFHPTQVLETGYEIITLWVSRMIMMSLFALEEIPFENVYLHGMVLDAHGKKMSKSKGNGIDPIDVIDTFGTDAVRLSLLIGSTPGNDMKLSEKKIESFRNFTNKLWNIGRYILTQSEPQKIESRERRTLADSWILARLHQTTREVTEHLNAYNFSLAGECLRDFTWNEFADWYVEIHKIEKNDAILRHVFETLLKLWHPFMPFVTEALWQEMQPENQLKQDPSIESRSKIDTSNFLMITKWPEDNNRALKSVDQKNALAFEKIKEIIVKIRNIRSVYHIDPAQPLDITFVSKEIDTFKSQKDVISKLARIQTNTFTSKDISPTQCACIHSHIGKIYIHLDAVLDIEAEKKRLSEELASLEKYKKSIEGRLANKSYTEKAPKAIVDESKQQLKDTKMKIEQIKIHQTNLS